jgi:hypothetical protein
MCATLGKDEAVTTISTLERRQQELEVESSSSKLAASYPGYSMSPTSTS